MNALEKTLTCAATALALGLGAAPADARITVTATGGRDEVDVELTSSFIDLRAGGLTFTVGPGESCERLTDPTTGLAPVLRCRLDPSQSVQQLSLVLGAGDDVATIVDRGSRVGAELTLDGGAGTDLLDSSSGALIASVLLGGEGDDVLRARPRSRSDRFVGGAGRDTLDLSPVAVPGVTSGVRVDLAAGTIVSSISGGEDQIAVVSAVGEVETVLGTPLGDVMAGGKETGVTLDGAAGADRLTAGSGGGILLGGAGADALSGGPAVDTLDGGPGLDDYSKGTDGDTFLLRDGALEQVSCPKSGTVVADLADKIGDPESCKALDVAARIHRFDTGISPRLLASGGVLRAVVACPAGKTETCSGTLVARRAGGAVLRRTPYRVPRGRSVLVSLGRGAALSAARAGRVLRLVATETDPQGRPRSVAVRARR